jgi:hypothetical protein
MFKNIIYAIPDSMVKGKTHVRVKFQALQGSTSSAIYIVRILRAEDKK